MQEYTSASRELYRARSLSISPMTALTIADVRREEKEKREHERRKRIVEQETYCMPTVAVSPPMNTEELVAHILSDEPYVDKTASSNYHTIDLIHEAVEELGSMPTLIEISNLRYVALGKLLTRFRYYYHGILVPFRPADRQCCFDVRVYGMRV